MPTGDLRTDPLPSLETLRVAGVVAVADKAVTRQQAGQVPASNEIGMRRRRRDRVIGDGCSGLEQGSAVAIDLVAVTPLSSPAPDHCTRIVVVERAVALTNVGADGELLTK